MLVFVGSCPMVCDRPAIGGDAFGIGDERSVGVQRLSMFANEWYPVISERSVLNVSLTPELDNFVLLKVKSGRYNSASEVVREALRLMQDHENLKAIQVEEIRNKIRAGLNDLDEGRYVEGTAEDLMRATLARGRAQVFGRTKAGQ